LNVENFSLINQLLLGGVSPILERNKRFKNKHEGESCYIFGNGVSLKDMDLGCFSDKIGFGCNFLFFHKDFHKLNVRYYTEPPPYWYYPFWKNPYTKKRSVNKLSLTQRKFQKVFNSVDYFVNLSNAPVLFGNNIFYIHHFGKKSFDIDGFDLSGSFVYTGALHAMIGMAIYMGFKKAYLVGCDYTHSPQRILHFYEKGRGSRSYDNSYNEDYFNLARDKIELITITNSNSTSKTLKSITYKDYTGQNESYNENYNLVNSDILKTLDQYDGYQIF
jgi:hypothetical protein